LIEGRRDASAGLVPRCAAGGDPGPNRSRSRRTRVLTGGAEPFTEQPLTILSSSPRSAGGLHDFF
jgi:hypothetical protein